MPKTVNLTYWTARDTATGRYSAFVRVSDFETQEEAKFAAIITRKVTMDGLVKLDAFKPVPGNA